MPGRTGIGLLRNWITAILALAVIGLATAFLFVSVDEQGWIKRPAPPGGRGRVKSPLVLDASHGGGAGNVEDTASGTPGALPDEVAPPAGDEHGGWVEVEPEPLWPATEAGVRSAADSRLPALRACWPSVPREIGGMAAAVVYLTVSPTGADRGAITKVSLQRAGRGDKPMETCMTEALSDLPFASPSGRLQVEYNLLLIAEGG